MSKPTRVGYDRAREIVQDAKEAEKVIELGSRIGATPYLKFTPYTNNRGVTVNMWTCISYSFKARPERTLLVHPTIVEPDKEETWEINHITTPWVVNKVARGHDVNLHDKEDSPFAGDIVGGWNE